MVILYNITNNHIIFILNTNNMGVLSYCHYSLYMCAVVNINVLSVSSKSL